MVLGCGQWFSSVFIQWRCSKTKNQLASQSRSGENWANGFLLTSKGHFNSANTTLLGGRGRRAAFITPPPVFWRFFCFFVSNITRKWLDRLARNFQGRCGVTMGRPDHGYLYMLLLCWAPWPDHILGQFGSKVNLFVITGHSSDDWR